MKIGKKLNLLMLILITFLFIGCQNSEQVNTDSVDRQNVNDVLDVGLSTENLLKFQSQLSEIVAGGDKEKCKEIDYEQYFNTCEANILANSAETAEDIGVCDEASNDVIKNQCTVLVQNK